MSLPQVVHTRRGGLEVVQLVVGDALAELAPSRGGLVTRYAVAGDEVLFMDEGTLQDLSKNVRGGVPVLFPLAGKAPAGSPMGQHGFARGLPFVVTASAAGPGVASVECTLEASAASRSLWPHGFSLSVRVSLETRSLSLRYRVTAPKGDDLPVHFGLHPYFRVPVPQKAQARVETQATTAFDQLTGKTGAPPPLRFDGELDAHLVDHRPFETTLHRGDGSGVKLEWSDSLPALVLWTQPEKAFVCVEPWSDLSLATGGQPRLIPGGHQVDFDFRIHAPRR